MSLPRRLPDSLVLDRARDILLTRGAAATTREIAAASGLSQAALVQRYATKQKLIEAALTPTPLDVAYILGPVDAPTLGVVSRLIDQLVERLPAIAVLRQSGADEKAMAVAHEALGQPELLSALLHRLEGRRDLVDTLLLGAHGAALMRDAGTAEGRLAPLISALAKTIDIAFQKGASDASKRD